MDIGKFAARPRSLGFDYFSREFRSVMPKYFSADYDGMYFLHAIVAIANSKPNMKERHVVKVLRDMFPRLKTSVVLDHWRFISRTDVINYHYRILNKGLGDRIAMVINKAVIPRFPATTTNIYYDDQNRDLTPIDAHNWYMYPLSSARSIVRRVFSYGNEFCHMRRRRNADGTFYANGGAAPPPDGSSHQAHQHEEFDTYNVHSQLQYRRIKRLMYSRWWWVGNMHVVGIYVDYTFASNYYGHRHYYQYNVCSGSNVGLTTTHRMVFEVWDADTNEVFVITDTLFKNYPHDVIVNEWFVFPTDDPDTWERTKVAMNRCVAQSVVRGNGHVACLKTHTYAQQQPPPPRGGGGGERGSAHGEGGRRIPYAARRRGCKQQQAGGGGGGMVGWQQACYMQGTSKVIAAVLDRGTNIVCHNKTNSAKQVAMCVASRVSLNDRAWTVSMIKQRVLDKIPLDTAVIEQHVPNKREFKVIAHTIQYGYESYASMIKRLKSVHVPYTIPTMDYCYVRMVSQKQDRQAVYRLRFNQQLVTTYSRRPRIIWINDVASCSPILVADRINLNKTYYFYKKSIGHENTFVKYEIPHNYRGQLEGATVAVDLGHTLADFVKHCVNFRPRDVLVQFFIWEKGKLLVHDPRLSAAFNTNVLLVSAYPPRPRRNVYVIIDDNNNSNKMLYDQRVRYTTNRDDGTLPIFGDGVTAACVMEARNKAVRPSGKTVYVYASDRGSSLAFTCVTTTEHATGPAYRSYDQLAADRHVWDPFVRPASAFTHENLLAYIPHAGIGVMRGVALAPPDSPATTADGCDRVVPVNFETMVYMSLFAASSGSGLMLRHSPNMIRAYYAAMLYRQRLARLVVQCARGGDSDENREEPVTRGAVGARRPKFYVKRGILQLSNKLRHISQSLRKFNTPKTVSCGG